MPEGQAYNHITKEYVPLEDAVELSSSADVDGSWYIKPGFAGYNSSVNNLWGYGSKATAMKAVRRYQQA